MIHTRTCTIEEAVRCAHSIPELEGSYGEEVYHARLKTVPHLLLIAEENGTPAGFKVGYERGGVFYSWMGGVRPAYRRRGVAKALAAHQEAWAKQRGYPCIVFKTRNYLRAMLIFALNNGFYITGVEEREDPMHNRIWLEKVL